MNSRLSFTSSTCPKFQGPISLESERRKGMVLIHTVERDIENFREKWLRNASDDYVDEWLEFIDFARSKADLKKSQNYIEFGVNINRVRTKEELKPYKDIIRQLDHVVERARLLDSLILTSKERLRESNVDHISKYCLSFAQEADSAEAQAVKCVEEFENGITKWTTDIAGGFVAFDKAVRELKSQGKSSFTDYIQNYGKVLHHMSITLDAVSKISDPIKHWVTVDEGYPKQLQNEINAIQKRKIEITEILRRQYHRVNDTKHKMQHTSFGHKKNNQKLQKALNERRMCRKRELVYQESISKIETDIGLKRIAHDETLQTIFKRVINSPSWFDAMSQKATDLQDEISKLEKKVQTMQKNMRTLRVERYKVQKEVHRLKVVYENSQKAVQMIHSFEESQEDDARTLLEEQKVLAAKVDGLRRIRFVKTHPETVKKIYVQGYVPGRKMDYSDPLGDAFKVVATDVGKDWSFLYQRLPFNPPRDPSARTRDIEVMDMRAQRRDLPSRQSALQSLEKWRQLSSVVSVNALVRTLKTIKKTDVAQKVQRKVMTVVN